MNGFMVFVMDDVYPFFQTYENISEQWFGFKLVRNGNAKRESSNVKSKQSSPRGERSNTFLHRAALAALFPRLHIMTLPLSPFRATQTKSLVLFCPVKRPEELHSSRLCSASLLPAAWTTRSHGEPLPPSPTPFYTFIMKYKYCYGLLIFFFLSAISVLLSVLFQPSVVGL